MPLLVDLTFDVIRNIQTFLKNNYVLTLFFQFVIFLEIRIISVFNFF